MDWSQIKHFKPEEFRCPCCGKADMDEQFIRSLDAVRSFLAFPFIINSGFRCVSYEHAKGRSGKSAHAKGKGADIAVWGERAADMVNVAWNHGFCGIGLKQHGDIDRRFIHLDTLEGSPSQPRPHIWTYP